jgi:hypothetical protein
LLLFFSVGLTSFVFLAARVATFFELEGTAFFVTITGFVTLQLSKVSIVNSRRIFKHGH